MQKSLIPSQVSRPIISALNAMRFSLCVCVREELVPPSTLCSHNSGGTIITRRQSADASRSNSFPSKALDSASSGFPVGVSASNSARAGATHDQWICTVHNVFEPHVKTRDFFYAIMLIKQGSCFFFFSSLLRRPWSNLAKPRRATISAKAKDQCFKLVANLPSSPRGWWIFA